MGLEFKKVSDFKRGIFSELLSDAYSFDGRWKHRCDSDWKEVDDFSLIIYKLQTNVVL